MPPVSFMSGYRMQRDAIRLHDQLASLRRLRHGGLHASVIATHKPIFDAMLTDVLALQERLEGQMRDVRRFTAIPRESRRFLDTARSVLEDTGELIELLIWLGAG